MSGPLRILFSTADCPDANVGNSLVENYCVPVLVPLALVSRVEAQSTSLCPRREDCLHLGLPVHFAQIACELNRGSKDRNQCLQETDVHKQVAVARHDGPTDTLRGNAPKDVEQAIASNDPEESSSSS